MTQQTLDMLADMKLSAMAAELANQLKDPSFAALGFEERLDMIVTAEWNKRQTNKINRLIRNAHFSASSATIEGIEYYEDRKLDKTQILRLATCKYIDEGHHVILKGASGNGKTYIACALGNAACRRFKKVAYIRMPELLDEITIARSSGELKKLLAAYKKVDLLILDEWLIRPLSPQEAYDLLAVNVQCSFALSTSPKAGIPELTRIQSPTAQSLKRLWIVLSIIRMRLWLRDASRCANVKD